MSFVFLSYSTKNARAAECVRAALEEAGIAYWMAPASIPPGGDYPSELANAIRDCGRVLLLLSPQSNDSVHVQREIERAIHHRKPVIPVLLEAFEPRGGMEYLISSSQFVEATATDPAAWLPGVVEAARAPLDTPPPKRRPSVRGFLKVDPSIAASMVAGIISVAALILSVLPNSLVGGSNSLSAILSNTADPGLLLGGLAAIIATAIGVRRLSSLRRRTIVVRWGDLVALGGFAIGAVLFGWLFLVTPLVAAALVALAYLPLRRSLIQRWGLLAIGVAGALGVAAWYLEGRFFDRLLPEAAAVALVPDCSRYNCEGEAASLYREIIADLDRLIPPDQATVLPRKQSADAFFENAEAFSRGDSAAHRVTLLNHQRLFQTVAFLTLQPATCGDARLKFTLEAAPVSRRPPVWSAYQLGNWTPLNNRNRVSGFVRSGESEPVALLVSGLILRDLVKTEAVDEDLLRQFLRYAAEDKYEAVLSAMPPDEAEQLRAPGFSGADGDTLRILFNHVVDALAIYSESNVDSALCDDAADRAVTQLSARNGLLDD